MLSLQDTWYFHDTLQVRSGVPLLDLLDGAPLGAATGGLSGAQPRHALQLWASLQYRALGAQLSGRWVSAAHVDGGTAVVPESLGFAALGTLGLRVFTDLGKTLHSSWTQGMRVSVGVNNLLDARARVTDGSGVTPLGFAPGYLDPLGRSVNLSLRKAF
jgi:outer membrane receptor protein involved in Fe transport